MLLTMKDQKNTDLHLQLEQKLWIKLIELYNIQLETLNLVLFNDLGDQPSFTRS